MKYTLQDLQEKRVYMEINSDEDFNKLIPYTNVIKKGTDVRHKYPYWITFNEEDEPGYTTTSKWFPENNFTKVEIKDLFFDLNDLQENDYYIELKNKQEIEDWKEIIIEKLPHIAENIFTSNKVFISFFDKSFTVNEEESFIKDGYKKVDLNFINKTSKEEIKTKLLIFTIDGETTYNLEIKWEDWELLKQGNKLKLL